MKRTYSLILWTRFALIVASSLCAPSSAPARDFTDPAPPSVHTTSDAAAPAPKHDADITFHAAAKPLTRDAATQDWPCFLGPDHNNFSRETKLLKDFSKGGPAIVWEVTKGEGYGAPAVAGGKVVLFHRVGDDEAIDCLDTETGNRYWRFTYPTNYRDRFGYCNGPRSSPVIGKDSVFALGAEGKLHCIDLRTGRLRWERDLMKEFKLTQNFFGVGSTPLLEGDKLIVNVGAPGGPCVAAFDAANGKMVWGAGEAWGPSYASPVPAEVHGKRRVFVFAGGERKPPTGGLLCIDPKNGHVDFSFPWRGTRRESVNASSPVVIGNQVFISECYGSGGALIDVLEDGSAKLVWSNPNFGTHFMSAVPKDGYLYGVDGHGPNDAFLVCVNLKDGKEAWRTQPEWEEMLESPAGARKLTTGTYRSWLMPVDRRCLCLGEYGHLLWLDLDATGYKELSRTRLFAAADTWTPPVLSHGLLYVCQNTPGAFHGEAPRLVCYDMRGNK